MEPRPPRPRSSRQFETSGTPPASGIGDRLYPPSADPSLFPGAEEVPAGMAVEQPLLPRQQRRQRRALRGLGITLVIIALFVVAGWFLRDTIRSFIASPTPAPTAIAVTDTNVAAPGTPTATPDSAALPNALATVTPTPEAPATATPRPQPDLASEDAAEEDGQPDEPDRDISAQTQPLLAFLPTQEQAPEGMIIADEAERSKADVVASLGGSDEAAQLLDDWGWSGNAFRDYIVPEGSAPPPGGATFLNVSVHRFADAASAANALVFYSDQVIFGQGLQEVEPPAIGETARLLMGSPGGVPLAVLYTQEGPILYRIGASTATVDSDPSAAVLDVAAEIVPGQSDGA